VHVDTGDLGVSGEVFGLRVSDVDRAAEDGLLVSDGAVAEVVSLALAEHVKRTGRPRRAHVRHERGHAG
jgi:hypothetical protein